MAAAALHAQQFEVAAIKPNNSAPKINDVRFSPGGRLTTINASVRLLINHLGIPCPELANFRWSGMD
jgi:hypothetical protein